MDVIEKQLGFLNETMKDTASERNAFLLKYHFGGLIAVLALLNLDINLIQSSNLTSIADYTLLIIGIILIISLSFIYFRFVLAHYDRFSASHRKLKYKYELTLHCMLCNGSNEEYQYYLEQSLSEKNIQHPEKIKPVGNTRYDFKYIADYLLDHHRRRFFEIGKNDNSYLEIAMLIIFLTLAIRSIFFLIEIFN